VAAVLSGKIENVTLRAPQPAIRNSQLRRIEPESRSAAFRVGSGLAPALLRWRLERTQTPDLLENTLGFELVFEPFQGAIHWFTFANDHFWHQ